jgi:multiple sugar transport system ATP-binding protein|uniref:ABC-type D-xylose/L-arabinose transporter n=1 Tax=uncultured haloarchaeon TaxID=160804 RepID=A5YST3_9EURY|nr:sugar ABC transporter ATP-binding protein [uncultured haloarchaeon]
MTKVTLTDITKKFGDVTAVDTISMSVPNGEFIVIVGPSGCGKSTTLRLIAGLESADEGDIRMHNQSVVDAPPDERDIAMVFQNYALYPHMTARRNITFGMRSTSSFSDAEIDNRVKEAADILGISELLDRKPQALSGGERQRVALGRAIVRDPDVFLMDEPLSNLDAKLRIRMRSELAKLHRELQTTTIYVTHDQTEAMTLADRVVVMNNGQVQQVDKPQQLYDYPNNRFVAEFIGDPAMNIFPVELRSSEQGIIASHAGFNIPLPGVDTSSLGSTKTAELGVRPEDLMLSTEAETEAPVRFSAEVSVTEPLGDSLLLECLIGETACRVQTNPRSSVSPGESITLSYNPERIHLFDETTGKTIHHTDSSSQEVTQLESVTQL